MKVLATSAVVAGALADTKKEFTTPFLEINERQTSVDVRSNMALADCLVGPKFARMDFGSLYEFQDKESSFVSISTPDTQSTLHYDRKARQLTCKHLTFDAENGPVINARSFKNVDFANLAAPGCDLQMTTVGDLVDFFYPGDDRFEGLSFFAALNVDITLKTPVLVTHCPKSNHNVFNMIANKQVFTLSFPAAINGAILERPMFYAEMEVPGLPVSSRPRNIESRTSRYVSKENFWTIKGQKEPKNNSELVFKNWKKAGRNAQEKATAKTALVRYPSDSAAAFKAATVQTYEVPRVNKEIFDLVPGLFSSSEEVADTILKTFRTLVEQVDKEGSKAWKVDKRFSLMDFIPAPATVTKDHKYRTAGYRITMLPEPEYDRFTGKIRTAFPARSFILRSVPLPDSNNLACHIDLVDADEPSKILASYTRKDLPVCALTDDRFGFLPKRHLFDMDELKEARVDEVMTTPEKKMALFNQVDLPTSKDAVNGISKDVCQTGIDGLGERLAEVITELDMKNNAASAFELQLVEGFAGAVAKDVALKPLHFTTSLLRINAFHTIGTAASRLLGLSTTAHQLLQTLQGIADNATQEKDRSICDTGANAKFASKLLAELKPKVDAIISPVNTRLHPALKTIVEFVNKNKAIAQKNVDKHKVQNEKYAKALEAMVNGENTWTPEGDVSESTLTPEQTATLYEGLEAVAHLDEIYSSFDELSAGVALAALQVSLVEHATRDASEGYKLLTGLDAASSVKLNDDANAAVYDYTNIFEALPQAFDAVAEAGKYLQTSDEYRKSLSILKEHLPEITEKIPAKPTVTSKQYEDARLLFGKKNLPKEGVSPVEVAKALALMDTYMGEYEAWRERYQHLHHLTSTYVSVLLKRKFPVTDSVTPAEKEEVDTLKATLQKHLKEAEAQMLFLTNKVALPSEYEIYPTGHSILNSCMEPFTDFETQIRKLGGANLAAVEATVLARQWSKNMKTLKAERPKDAVVLTDRSQFLYSLQDYMPFPPEDIKSTASSHQALLDRIDTLAMLLQNSEHPMGILGLGFVLPSGENSKNLAVEAVTSLLKPFMNVVSSKEGQDAVQEIHDLKAYLRNDDNEQEARKLMQSYRRLVDIFGDALLSQEHLYPSVLRHSSKTEKFHLKKRDNLRVLQFRAQGAQLNTGYSWRSFRKQLLAFELNVKAFQTARPGVADKLVKRLSEEVKVMEEYFRQETKKFLKDSEEWGHAARAYDNGHPMPSMWNFGTLENVEDQQVPSVFPTPTKDWDGQEWVQPSWLSDERRPALPVFPHEVDYKNPVAVTAEEIKLQPDVDGEPTNFPGKYNTIFSFVGGLAVVLALAGGYQYYMNNKDKTAPLLEKI